MTSFEQELPFQKVELLDSVALENQMQQLAALCVILKKKASIKTKFKQEL
jgi:hypothetical protein